MAKQKINILPVGAEFEKYIIEKELGRGGMGIVYLAKHKILDSRFAIKVLLPDSTTSNPKNVDRFIREAKIASKINHKNLVGVHDVGKNEKYGVYFIVMDYVDGGSLKQQLKSRGSFCEKEIIVLLIQIVSALNMANEHGMVHRDIKPDNIMFDSDGTAKLADLGIAKTSEKTDTMITVEASVFGTPAYMSPEQALDSHNVDIRSDIYSLGMVAYEMVTGQRVYKGDSMMQILSQVIRDDEVPSLDAKQWNISKEFADLISLMVSKKADKRPQSPSELLQKLKSILGINVNAGIFPTIISHEDVDDETEYTGNFNQLNSHYPSESTVESKQSLITETKKQDSITGDITRKTAKTQKSITQIPFEPKSNYSSSGNLDAHTMTIPSFSSANESSGQSSGNVFSQNSTSSFYQGENNSGNRMKKIISIALIFVLLCVVAGGIFTVLNSSKPNYPTSENVLNYDEDDETDSMHKYVYLLPLGVFAVLGSMIFVSFRKM